MTYGHYVGGIDTVGCAEVRNGLRGTSRLGGYQLGDQSPLYFRIKISTVSQGGTVERRTTSNPPSPSEGDPELDITPRKLTQIRFSKEVAVVSYDFWVEFSHPEVQRRNSTLLR